MQDDSKYRLKIINTFMLQNAFMWYSRCYTISNDVIFLLLRAHNDLTTIIAMVIADTDTDGDGYISDEELYYEYRVKFDASKWKPL